jgi:hypothetical protein
MCVFSIDILFRGSQSYGQKTIYRDLNLFVLKSRNFFIGACYKGILPHFEISVKLEASAGLLTPLKFEYFRRILGHMPVY